MATLLSRTMAQLWPRKTVENVFCCLFSAWHRAWGVMELVGRLRMFLLEQLFFRTKGSDLTYFPSILPYRKGRCCTLFSIIKNGSNCIVSAFILLASHFHVKVFSNFIPTTSTPYGAPPKVNFFHVPPNRMMIPTNRRVPRSVLVSQSFCFWKTSIPRLLPVKRCQVEFINDIPKIYLLMESKKY